MSCTRASRLAALVAFSLVALATRAYAQDSMSAASLPPAQKQDEGTPHPLARWLDAETFTVSARYDYIEDAHDRTLQNRIRGSCRRRSRPRQRRPTTSASISA
jgi:hypothetical protein